MRKNGISTTYFYPRPPRGGRRDGLRDRGLVLDISIHALREEGDTVCFSPNSSRLNFYPRPPRGGRRDHRLRPHRQGAISIHALREEGDLRHLPCVPVYASISIHALREEGDRMTATGTGIKLNFYPRPPRGGRLTMHSPSGRYLGYFYPRPPRGGRRPGRRLPAQDQHISIHALREEGDVWMSRFGKTRN